MTRRISISFLLVTETWLSDEEIKELKKGFKEYLENSSFDISHYPISAIDVKDEWYSNEFLVFVPEM